VIDPISDRMIREAASSAYRELSRATAVTDGHASYVRVRAEPCDILVSVHWDTKQTQQDAGRDETKQEE